MHAALSYLGTLPPSTITYNGHEYTKSNFAFAKSVEPDSAALARLDGLIGKSEGVTTGKTTVGDEKEWNPFMRLDSPAIRYVRQSRNCMGSMYSSTPVCSKATGASDDIGVMTALREMKNSFKG